MGPRGIRWVGSNTKHCGEDQPQNLFDRVRLDGAIEKREDAYISGGGRLARFAELLGIATRLRKTLLDR